MTPTFRLFSLPSAWEGVGSVIDLYGGFHNYNCDTTPEEVDRKAFIADMDAILGDLRAAMNQTLQEVSR